MPDYQNAKIYKLVNETLGLTYFGSTTKQLCVRKSQHKYNFKKDLHCISKILFEGEGEVEIVLIEDFPCNSKKELLLRERFYIENNGCVNKNIPSRKNNEWREENREYLRKKNNEYRETNKAKILKQQSEKFTCECGGKYTRKHKSKHFKTKKHKIFISVSL